jgi:hypothetical protein
VHHVAAFKVRINGSGLKAFYYYVKRIWLRTLRLSPGYQN